MARRMAAVAHVRAASRRAGSEQWLLERAFSVHEWIVLPLVFFLAVLAAAGSRVAVFAWAFALLSMLGLTWIYVTSDIEWDVYVYYSGHRVIDSAIVSATALVPLLASAALRIDRR